MPEEDIQAIIRPYNHATDAKLVKLVLGKQCLEPLAVANRAATTHPLVVALWIALSSIFVQFMHWWPKPEFGFMGNLLPLPAFAATAVPIMFYIDWKNRPAFEALSTQVLTRPDVVDLELYYARSPASGVWILELDDNFVGLIAVDASRDSLSGKTVLDSGRTTTNAKVKYTKGTADVAKIRHLYVYESYRTAEPQRDLVEFAANHVFRTSGATDRIAASPSPYAAYIGKALAAEGFTVAARGRRAGVFGKDALTYELTREKWEQTQK